MDKIVAEFNNQNKYAICGQPAEKSIHPEPDTQVMNFLEDGNQYVLDCVSDVSQIAALKDEWVYLEQNFAEPFVYFQSFDWCYQWCKLFAGGTDGNQQPQVKIFVLRRNSEMVMVWPMMIIKSRAGLDNLTFLTEPHGQYGNIICNVKLVPLKVGQKVWHHICDNCGVDAVTLDQYPKNSFLKAIVKSNGIVEKSDKFSSILDLSSLKSWDEYNAALPKKLRKQRNQRRNKLAKMGAVDYEIHFGGTDEYVELVALALKWKKEWLSQTGRRATVLSMDTTRQFISNLSGSPENSSSMNKDALLQGAVLGALTLDGKPIGIEIGMCLNGHYYSYLGAFDWEYKKMSPGKIQIEMAQQWACEVGLRKFDFLGDPADYKSTWTDMEGALESRSVPRTIRGYFYCMFWKAHLRPWARKIFNRLSATNRSRLLKMLGIGEKGVHKKPAQSVAQDKISQRPPGTKSGILE